MSSTSFHDEIQLEFNFLWVKSFLNFTIKLSKGHQEILQINESLIWEIWRIFWENQSKNLQEFLRNLWLKFKIDFKQFQMMKSSIFGYVYFCCWQVWRDLKFLWHILRENKWKTIWDPRLFMDFKGFQRFSSTKDSMFRYRTFQDDLSW